MAQHKEELKIFSLLKTLPAKERNFYFMMQAYEHALTNLNNYNDKERVEPSKLISEFFINEITRILSHKSPVYNSQDTQNDHAEKSETVDKIQVIEVMQAIKATDSHFDDKLGQWASSFSNESESDFSSSSSSSEDVQKII